MGNRGEALRVFGKCRELFRDELGADPSQETERVFLEILQRGAVAPIAGSTASAGFG